jgi:hypothetical protein
VRSSAEREASPACAAALDPLAANPANEAPTRLRCSNAARLRAAAEVVELGLQPQILGGGRSGGQPFQPSAKPGDASEVAPPVAAVSLQHASSALLRGRRLSRVSRSWRKRLVTVRSRRW